MKLFISSFFSCFISFLSFSQTLIINEVSQGPSGVKEYVEFLVIPTSTTQNCEPCMDLRGWIIDDNSGYFSNGVTTGTGVAAGAVRFSTDAIWSCVPFGTLIVIYNDGDINTAIPTQDISLNDGNCRLILPVNSNLLESQTVSPGAGNTTYPTTGWTTSGSLWSPLGMSNNNDSFQTYAPTNTLAPVFGVSWGNNNSNNIIYFAGGSSNTVFYFANTTSNDPTLQANWSSGTCAAPDNQTPGLPNNTANTTYINQLTNNCSPIQPLAATSQINAETCSCNGSATVTASGSIPNYTYSWTNSSNIVVGQNTSISGLCAGTYNCRITSLNGCTFDLQVVIPSNPSQTIPTFDPIGPFCSGTNFTLPSTSTNGVTGSWSPAINNQTTTIYTFTPDDITCASTTNLTVQINNATVPTFDPIGPNCIGDVFSLPSSSTNGIQGTWSPQLNFTQTTNYTFTPDANACATNANLTVTVNSCGLNAETCFKIVTFTQVTISSCVTGSDTGDEDPALSIWCNSSVNDLLFGTEWTLNIPSNGTYNLPNPWNQCQQSTNVWNVGAIPSNVQSLNVFVQTYESDDSDCENSMSSGDDCRTSGNHTMDLTLGTHVLNIGGSLSYTYTVTEATLVSNVALSSITCNGNTYDANLTVTYLNPNSPCGINGNLGNLVVNGQVFNLTSSPQTITLTNLPSDGLPVNINAYFTGDYASCQYNATNVFTAPIPPTLVSFTGDGTYCSGETPNDVLVSVSGTAPFSATYTLDGIVNTVQSTTNPISLGNLNGVYVLSQINAGGCNTTVNDTVIISSSSSITPDFSQLGPFCTGDVFSIPNTSTNGIQGSWSPLPNSTQTTTYSFTPLNNACATEVSMTITISSNINPTFSPINPICLNGIAPNLPANSTNGISGTWSPATITTSTAGNFNFIFSPSAGQCASVTSQNITITNPLIPSFAAIGPFCINATPTNLPNQSLEGVSGTWNPSVISTSTLGSSDYTFTPSAGFCASTSIETIFIGDNTVNAGSDLAVCEGQTVTLSAQGTPPFDWNNNVVNNVPFIVNQTSVYTVSSTQNGCTATDNVTVFVTPNPNVDFTFSPVTGNAPLSVVFSNQTINGTSYTWDFGNGNSQNVNSTIDVSQIYPEGGIYSITLYASNNGCMDSITYDLIVYPDPNIDLNVPNVFSPNNDLANDVYSLNFENAKSLNALIINRWGNVVYTFTSPLQTWDGTSNGIECPDGVYFVKYEVTSINNEIFKGQQFIHLVR